MSVDSYLELFTTLFGWAFYGVLWDVLVATGIVYLPFLGILIDNWREPAEGGQFGTVTDLSLRRMEIELFIALLVVVLAGQPAALTPLNPGTLSYTPPLTLDNPVPTTATVAAPDSSTYGATGFTGSPATVNVPVWWYAVLAMTSGFNHAVVEGLPAASDLRTFEQQAHLATIADPRLRQGVSDFFSECYVPARSRFQAQRPDTPAVTTVLGTYGEDDPDWVGSHVYRDTPGFYDTLRPTKQIPGWTYDPARDTEYDPALPPSWGKPTCKQWWEDAAIGLRQKVLDEADATFAGLSSLVVAIAPILAGEQQKDAVARTVLSNSPPVWSSNDLVANNSGSTGWVGTVVESARPVVQQSAADRAVERVIGGGCLSARREERNTTTDKLQCDASGQVQPVNRNFDESFQRLSCHRIHLGSKNRGLDWHRYLVFLRPF